MSPERWRRVEEIYHKAGDLEGPERSRYVAEACEGDAELRAEVESLLAHHSAPGQWIDRPAVEGAASYTTAQLSAGMRLGPYEVLEPLGAGGMGRVYRARDTRLGRLVAVKVLPPERFDDFYLKSRFLQEARAASALNHPNVVTIHDIGTDAALPYLVLELVEGAPLDRRLRAGKLDAKTAIDYAQQICRALRVAHEAGIVHRDIKPSNLMVTAAGVVKVLDFGLAKLARGGGERSGDTAVTVPGLITGTVAYMSPEQAEGRPLDGRTDLFSLGVVLYEMLAGARPFERSSTIATLHAIVAEPPPPLGGLPAELDRVIAKLLTKDRERRYRTAAELESALKEASASLEGPAAVSTAKRSAPGSSIAVLPFRDLTPAQDQEYFCEGIAEEIINALAQTRGLRVASRTSSFQAARHSADLRAIGEALTVETVLEGSVRKSGARLRITVQLARAADGFHIWSKRFDREEGDIFEVQEEVAGAVVKAIAPPSVSGVPTMPRRTADPRAYELYLRGRYFWNRRPGEVVFRALECFQRAVEADPTFAAAYAGIADVYATLGSWEAGVLPPAEALIAARDSATKALAIEPSLADAYASLGYVAQHFEWNLPEAEALFRKSVELNPSYNVSRHWHSHNLVAAGRFEESLAESRKALELDPVDLVLMFHLAWHYQMARQANETIEQAERVIQMDASLHWGHYFLASGYELKGEYDKAVAGFREACRTSSDNPVMRAWLGHALALAGERREALQIAEEAVRLGDTRGHFAYEAALTHAVAGDAERAFELLNRARVQRTGWISYVLVDPRLDVLRSDPRFPQFLGSLPMAKLTLSP